MKYCLFVMRLRAITMSALVVMVFFLAAFDPAPLAAQSRVIYMNNGSIIRCYSYHYHRDRTFFVSLRDSDIVIPRDSIFETGRYYRHSPPGYELYYRYDTVSHTFIEQPSYYIRRKGFFIQGQLSVVGFNGVLLALGYRFNTYAAFGVNMGAGYGLSLVNNATNYHVSIDGAVPGYVTNSGYSPFTLYLTGNMLKGGITPFYSAEAGYLLPWYKNLHTNARDGAYLYPLSYYTNFGGPIFGAGIGCRFYRRRYTHLFLALNFNAGYVNVRTNGFQSFSNGTAIYTITNTRSVIFQPSLRFGVGF